METCVQSHPKITKKPWEAKNDRWKDQNTCCAKNTVYICVYIYRERYSDYKCVWSIVEVSPAQEIQTIKHSPSIILFSIWAFNAILLMASPSFNYFLISFFFAFSLLLINGSTTGSTNLTKHHHKWVGPIGHRLISVNVNGSGADFRSVQAAVDSVPVNNTENVVIQISAGYYM